MIKYIFIMLLSFMFTFPATADDGEPSLIDLFG